VHKKGTLLCNAQIIVLYCMYVTDAVSVNNHFQTYQVVDQEKSLSEDCNYLIHSKFLIRHREFNRAAEGRKTEKNSRAIIPSMKLPLALIPPPRLTHFVI
jgi:hypothetical protein